MRNQTLSIYALVFACTVAVHADDAVDDEVSSLKQQVALLKAEIKKLKEDFAEERLRTSIALQNLKRQLNDSGRKRAPVADVTSGGVITGQILFKGVPPELPPLVEKGANVKDKDVCSVGTVPDERLIVGQNRGIANIFVYLIRAPKGLEAVPPPKDPIVLDRRNCRYFPRAQFIRTGQTLRLLNSDPVTTNVHTHARKNSNFNRVFGANDRDGVSSVFRRQEDVPVAVTCDYHSWMKAWVLPLDHSFAAVTDRNGTFKIQGLPVGEHEIVVWHEGHFLERRLLVEVKKNESTTLELTYSIDRFQF